MVAKKMMEEMEVENGLLSTTASQQRGQHIKKRSLDQEPDGPEALVRGDTRAVNLLRSFVVVALVVATVVTAVATHRLLTRIELHSFMKDFKAISTSFVETFMDDLNLKMWQASTLSVSMTGADTLHSSVPAFAQLVKGPQATTYAAVMVYSPLLRDEAERATWELFARGEIGNSKQDISNLCFVCGSEDFSVGAIDNIIQVPSYPPFTCGTIQKAGFGGLISSGQCPEAQQIVQQACNCQRKITNSTGSQVDVSNVTQIFHLVNGTPAASKGPRPYSPIWQVSGYKQSPLNMFDQMSDPIRRQAISAAVSAKTAVLSRTKFEPGDFEKLVGPSTMPKYSVFYPIFEGVDGKDVIGTISFDYTWNFFSSKVLPVGSQGVVLVVENTCEQSFTYSVGEDMRFNLMGIGDLHDPSFDTMVQQSTFDDFRKLQAYSSLIGINSEGDDCKYRVSVYPSGVFQRKYYTHVPTVVTVIVIVIFLFTSTVFYAYDRLVRQLQNKVMKSAVQYNSMLASLFPANVRSRLFNSTTTQTLDAESNSEEHKSDRQQKKTFLPRLMETPKLQLKNYLANTLSVNVASENNLDEEPIADLFPHTTVFFADIAGFTAWSSEREPSHVFKLLETLYSAFDRIAAKLGVFKVETVGDCYVAVTGLPEPNENHAVIMAHFARECLSIMSELTRSLESTLGPSTAGLALRIGMHSGPVIAGVLRGDKSRFQLFGDTMNTASRMESNGQINKIQVSLTTADLLAAAGKSDWVHPRSDLVAVKGKGEMQTFWVYPQGRLSRVDDSTSKANEEHYPTPVVKPNQDGTWCCTDGGAPSFYASNKVWDNVEQLADWNVSLLSNHLQKIVARRQCASPTFSPRLRRKNAPPPIENGKKPQPSLFQESLPRDEVVDTIAMPEFSVDKVKHYVDPTTVKLQPRVLQQLRFFVERIAATYHTNNAFHNFEHASHVAMSSSKLMKRIIAPDGVDYFQRSIHKTKRLQAIAKEIHETTFGISSDPLLQFAAVFSALIHDVDHEGVPNSRLSHEMTPTAIKYDHKSVAEQHSVQLAWSLFMDDQYLDLRACICESQPEMHRFRQLVVNAVIATDIADKSLQSSRQRRWDQAFHSDIPDANNANRRATIVYCYILQASDVAHTMQHWHTYRKWNERLFEERYHEYQQGRTKEDPSVTWYENELDFFDKYIIPLARKLEECGVFGVSSLEYKSHAIENRQEWASKGRAIVDEMVAKVNCNAQCHHQPLQE